MLAVPRHRDLIVPGQSGEREHHPGCGAGVRSGDAALDETYDAVKPQRLRIGGTALKFPELCPIPGDSTL